MRSKNPYSSQEQPRREIMKGDKLGRQGGSGSQEQLRREIMKGDKPRFRKSVTQSLRSKNPYSFQLSGEKNMKLYNPLVSLLAGVWNLRFLLFHSFSPICNCLQAWNPERFIPRFLSTSPSRRWLTDPHGIACFSVVWPIRSGDKCEAAWR